MLQNKIEQNIIGQIVKKSWSQGVSEVVVVICKLVKIHILCKNMIKRSEVKLV